MFTRMLPPQYAVEYLPQVTVLLAQVHEILMRVLLLRGFVKG